MNLRLFFALLLIAMIFASETTTVNRATVSAISNYSHDGSNNNPSNPTWGKTGTPLIRMVPTAYDDNIASPVGGIPSRLPSPRLISNLLFGRDASGLRPINPRLVSDILTFWGQFVDHDVDFSPDSDCDHFDISIPRGDYFYDAPGDGNKQMKFCRTIPVSGTGVSTTNKRQLPNTVNAWLDGSNVYGNTNDAAKALRTLQNGLMKTSSGPDGPLLPINNDGNGNMLVKMANPVKRVATTSLFAAGDPRANENPVLTCLHTLFVREHNRRASALPKSWSDEQKYQEARRWVIGHIQSITFNEYLPTLMGKKPPAYKYNNTLNPQVSVFFSTVAFRYGHDEISGVLTRFADKGLPYKDGHMLLRDAYFFPDSVSKVGISAYLRGASVNQQNAVDAQMDEDVRTYLFNQSPAFATDLAARNMQRARDHGIARYNECRQSYGLAPCKNFACVNSDPRIVALLNEAYGTDNVTYLDPYLGGLLEKKLPGSNLGELFTVSILEQLVRIRNADRFWYQNKGVFSSSELSVLEATKLSDIIKRNTDISILPKDVFNRKNISAAAALGGYGELDTKYLIAIIIPSVISAILIIIVVGMCFSNFSKNRVQENTLYAPLNVNDN